MVFFHFGENKTINQLREETKIAGSLIPLPENTKFERILAENVYAEWITCGEVDHDRIFMFMHGGGYYRGSIAATRATVARISAEAKVRCLSIEYRLAPEHPFPAAIDDTFTAYNWLLKEGLNPKNIIVSGQSAGGGLCLALLLKLKEKNSPIKFAKVNGPEEEELLKKMHVNGYPTLFFYRDGEPIPYGGGRMASEMVEWVEKKIGPPATVLEKAENVKEFIDNNDVVVVGFFSDPESEAAKQYKEAVRDYEEYPCAITADMEAAKNHDVSTIFSSANQILCYIFKFNLV